jgi:CheY-like chemotaxis protein
MPIMDGYEFATELSKFNRLHKKIIATTSAQGEYHLEKCISCGINDTFTKPIKSKVIHKTLSDHL